MALKAEFIDHGNAHQLATGISPPGSETLLRILNFISFAKDRLENSSEKIIIKGLFWVVNTARERQLY